MDHGTYDEYWTDQVVLRHLEGITHPILNVAGWFDAEDFYGPMSIYYTMEAENPNNQSTLVAGPWLHGGWRRMEGDHLGCVDFSTRTSRHFQREIQYPFFSYYLKDKGEWDAPEAVMFETGANRWHRFEAWPPENAVPTNIYFHHDGTLSFDPPGGEGSDQYVSDPAKPVPFSSEIRTTQGHLWMIEDQRFASTRPDVLVYQTAPLEEDVTIAGPVVANLFASTTGTDSDWIVKLIDVYPGNAPDSDFCSVPMGDFQMLLTGEIMRGKFRNSFSDPEPITPNQVVEYEIDLHDRFHTFLAGHRIMVQVQSTWFPVYDRNPHKFLDIYRAETDDFEPATQTVFRSAQHASHLVLRIMEQH
jgi:putative CocE/NonD family hydrolase